MTDQKTSKSPHPTTIPRPRPAAAIDRARRIREILPQGGEHLRRVEFTAGEVLVRDGVVAEDGMAYYVLEGILREEQVIRDPEKGLVVRTLYDVTPGEIAYTQALIPEHAGKPAHTRVVAVTDGAAVFVALDDLEINKQAQRLIEDLDRKLQRTLETHDRKLDEGARKFFDLLAELAVYTRKRFGGECTPRALLLEIHHTIRRNEELNKIVEITSMQTTEAKRECERLAASLADALQANADLERKYGEAIRVGVEARQKMNVAVTTIEDERRLMQMRALGAEIYFDRVRGVWARMGQDTQPLDFEPDEAELLLGGTPEGLGAIKRRLQAKRARQWSDDEIDAAFELGVQPSSSIARLLDPTAPPSAHEAPASRASRPKMATLDFDLHDAAVI
ncbi:MAG TPA: hypothetical protein VN397_03425, partial [Candidatus Methylomirabilis sp.]|nr:hypothetical protein [Candidatus Methylomirabilis sp.]